ncbi:MAG: hypothetical protein JXM69_18965 [Anaerolineae bacterium]|nr:hypothetical protein [Anaerolineae bacterium]
MTQKKIISISIPLIFLAFAVSGCGRSCPQDGKWETGEESGVTSIVVENCTVPYVYYTITVSGVQYSGTIAMLDTCRIDNQQFNCPEIGYPIPRYTVSGKFTDNTAEGQLILTQGYRDLTQDVTLDWKASPPQ